MISLFSCVLFNCGTSEKEEPQSLIFSELEEITNCSYGAGTFHYYLPPEVAYAVLGIFTNNIIGESGVITNEDDFKAGSRTGRGMGRESVTASNIWTYDKDTNDFTYSLYGGAANLYWGVWGYDKYGNLTHSSSKRGTITFP